MESNVTNGFANVVVTDVTFTPSGVKTLLCTNCNTQRPTGKFNRKDFNVKRGVWKLKNPKGKLICTDCIEREEAEWGPQLYKNFEEHCTFLSKTGAQPWTYSGEKAKGRKFADKGKQTWDEIRKRIRELREKIE